LTGRQKERHLKRLDSSCECGVLNGQLNRLDSQSWWTDNYDCSRGCGAAYQYSARMLPAIIDENLAQLPGGHDWKKTGIDTPAVAHPDFGEAAIAPQSITFRKCNLDKIIYINQLLVFLVN